MQELLSNKMSVVNKDSMTTDYKNVFLTETEEYDKPLNLMK